MFFYDDFFTENIRKWLIGKKDIIGDYGGFYINDEKVVLFDNKHLIDFLGNYKVYFYLMSMERYNEFKKMDIPHKRTKMNSYIYFIDDSFIGLLGKKYKKIRYGVNRYNGKVSVTNHLDVESAKFMLDRWKNIRSERHWITSISGEKYFFENHLYSGLISNTFYIDGKVVGYSVVEHIRDNLFNLLFRKIDTNYSQLVYFIDYYTYTNIYKLFGNFYINSGDDGGEKEARKFKINNFNVVKDFEICSVSIEKSVSQPNKLF